MATTLTSAQIEFVREIVGELSYSSIQSLCDDLNTAQEAAMRDDIDLWEIVRDKHLKMSGGTDGIDIDKGRDRKAIRGRVRLRLRLSSSGSAGGLFRVPVYSGYPDYC